jgi:hypothetical protein
MAVNSDYDSMALRYNPERNWHADTLAGKALLRDAIDRQISHRAAVRRQRRKTDSITLIKRLVIVITCFVAVMAGAIVADVVFAFLSPHVPTIAHVCTLVYVRKC